MDRQKLQEQIEKIIEFVREFCEQKLNEEYFELAERFVQELGSTKNPPFIKGQPKVWAAAIIKVLSGIRNLDDSLLPFIFNGEINSFFGINNFMTKRKSNQIWELIMRNPSIIKNTVRNANRFKFWELKGTMEINPDFIKYTVLYGTNRKANWESNKIHYNNLRDNFLHLGYCEISIPSSHRIGNVERPGWFKNVFFEESPKDHFTILLNKKMDEIEFVKLLQQKIGKTDERDVLLFIHGFNVEFDEAMKRTAQLGYDLNFKGGVTAFSWPSNGSVSGYIADLDSAKLSTNYLCNFIKLLIRDNVNKLHIIAHSMGNMVLTQALLLLKEENFLPNIIINQIVLAAPDIDKDIFVNQIMPSIHGMARLTLYASNKDKALITSRKIRKDYIRLGEGGNNIVIVDGLDSIDASKVDTSLLGHGYFAETQSLLNDMHMVLLGIPPDKRILDERNKMIDGVDKKYWVFRSS